MKSLLFKIFLLLLTAIFVLSTSGIFFIEHNCYKEQKTDIHFIKNTSENCCEHEQACCTSEKLYGVDICCETAAGNNNENNSGVTKNNCCVNKVVFIKTISPDFNNSNTKLLSFVPVVFNAQAFTCKLVIENYGISLFKPPPITLSQRIVSTSSLLL